MSATQWHLLWCGCQEQVSRGVPPATRCPDHGDKPNQQEKR